MFWSVCFRETVGPMSIHLTVIDGFCKMGRVDDAMKVLGDMMTGKFCAPDAVTQVLLCVACLLKEEQKKLLMC